ncbi:hypothetical protein MIR68_001799 [Amoeboaphelidium protococcarum]|nr:hypothetical protein MIR68_001799 [Amoeboaphelidium protococcarum]
MSGSYISLRKRQRCSVCGFSGHSADECFAPNGGWSRPDFDAQLLQEDVVTNETLRLHVDASTFAHYCIIDFWESRDVYQSMMNRWQNGQNDQAIDVDFLKLSKSMVDNLMRPFRGNVAGKDFDWLGDGLGLDGVQVGVPDRAREMPSTTVELIRCYVNSRRMFTVLLAWRYQRIECSSSRCATLRQSISRVCIVMSR